MKNVIRYLLLFFCILMCLGSNCRCPFDPIVEIEVWTISPENDAIITDPEVTLIWNYSFSGSDRYIVSHFVYVGTSPDDLSLVEDEHPDTFYTLTSLAPSTTYYWRILTTIFFERSWGDTDLRSGESEIATFTTSDIFYEPGQIHTPYPDSGAIHVDSILTMFWSQYNPDGHDYSFDVYLGTTTDPPLIDAGLTELIRNLDTLAGGITYYWRVVGYHDADTTEGNLWEFTTAYPSGTEIFALLEVDARQAPSGYHVEENLRARFDSALAVGAPVIPLQADSVFVEGVMLNWNAANQNYSYFEFSMPFIENGQANDFTVYGNAEVPTLNTSFTFPACTLGITSPESFESVSINGFEVTWDGSECGGTVWLALMDGTDSTGVIKETANDGIDSLTAVDLQPLGGQTGYYNLIIFKLVEENIVANGYMSESLIRCRAINIMEQINIHGG